MSAPCPDDPRLAILMISRTVLLLSLLLSCVVSVSADDNWPRFRGPNGTGTSDAKTIPVKWTDQDIRWRVTLPGTGNSSPVIWGQKLFVTSADETRGQRSLQCLETTTGQALWTQEFPFEKFKTHKNNSFASSTPAVDERYVYVVWQSPQGSPLMAFTHEGKKVWEFELGKWEQGQGGAASPIVFGDQVFVSHDHQADSALFSVDRNTGKQLWKIPRKGERACFTTPCVYETPAGETEIVFTHCYEGIIGVDPVAGTQRWHIDVFGTHSQRAIGSPVVFEDLVIGSSGGVGGEKNIVAVRPLAKSAELQTAEEIWRVSKTAPHVPTPIVYQDKIFLWEDKGVVSACDARTGKVLTQKRVGGTYFASPIIVDGKLYNIDVTGKVFVVSATEELEVLGRNSLPEGGRATLAVGDGHLFARTQTSLFCLGGK